MVEQRVGLCAISEPNRTVDSWLCSQDGLSAICYKHEFLAHPCNLFKTGVNFVAVKYGTIIFTSVYVSPNVDIGSFRILLDELDDLLGMINDACLILCGDFNSHSAMWGSTLTDSRGILLQNWAANHDLRLVNHGTAPTCIRPQGDSIIDLTWVLADLIGYISEWRVRSDLESLSDHQCVTFSLGGPLSEIRSSPLVP